MPDITQYNQWRKDNPQGSIIDFCGDECDLDTITDIITFSKTVDIEKFTPEIELKIRAEISRCFSEVIKKTEFGLEKHFKDCIEYELEDSELEFQFDGYDFEYDSSYNLGIEIDDQFSEYINFKLESRSDYDNLLDSQQNRRRLLKVTQEAPIFLTALAKALQENNNTTPISFNYDGFEFSYDDLESLPQVVFDDQIQEYIENKYSESTRLSDINFIQKIQGYYLDQIRNNFYDEDRKAAPANDDPQYLDYLDSRELRFKEFIKENAEDINSNLAFYHQLEAIVANDLGEFGDNITPENIYMYMSVFMNLHEMFNQYDEQCALELPNLVEAFDDLRTSTYRTIIDGVVKAFDYSVIDDIVTSDQLDNMLDLCAIEHYLDNSGLGLTMNDACFDSVSVLRQIVDGFEDSIQTWDIRETIIRCNDHEIYKSIKGELKRDNDYSTTSDKFAEALTTGNLLDQHRMIAAVMHVINSKQSNKTIKSETRQPLDETLSGALGAVEHYHKTFVLGNNIDVLKYPSKHEDKMTETDISQTLDKLQFTGRHLNRQQQIASVESNILKHEANITRWQHKISQNNQENNKLLEEKLLEDGSVSEKKKKKDEAKLVKNLKNNEDTELQSMKAEEQITQLNNDIDLLKETVVPKKGKQNILVPTFIFTVGYKDEEGKTLKRKFIEVPISDGSLKIISSQDFERENIESLLKKTDESFKSHVMNGKDIDARDLEEKHSFDSERIFNTFISDPANIQAILRGLVSKISEEDADWNKDNKKCKIYGLTILAHSTNATCRNCTRVYIDLSNDREEGSFHRLLTDQINNIDGLFAHEHSQQKEGIRIRSLVIADYNYHEHQEFASSHPSIIVQRGKELDVKGLDSKTFVEIVSQKNSATNGQLHQGPVFKSGR